MKSRGGEYKGVEAEIAVIVPPIGIGNKTRERDEYASLEKFLPCADLPYQMSHSLCSSGTRVTHYLSLISRLSLASDSRTFLFCFSISTHSGVLSIAPYVCAPPERQI